MLRTISPERVANVAILDILYKILFGKPIIVLMQPMILVPECSQLQRLNKCTCVSIIKWDY